MTKRRGIMPTHRLEAFSDGVLAIIITIMVLELRPPHGADAHALLPLLPKFCSYALSFIYLGIYWNHHHHMFQVTEGISDGVLATGHLDGVLRDHRADLVSSGSADRAHDGARIKRAAGFRAEESVAQAGRWRYGIPAL